MAEAVAAVSLLSAVVQLVDFGSKVCKRLHEYTSEMMDVPQSLQLIRKHIPMLINILQRMQSQSKSNSISEATAGELKLVIDNAFEQVETLKKVLDEILPSEKSSSYRKPLLALKSLTYDKKLQKINDQLQYTLIVLNFHQITYQSEVIEQLKQGMMQLLSGPSSLTSHHSVRSAQIHDETLDQAMGPSFPPRTKLEVSSRHNDTVGLQSLSIIESSSALQSSCKCHSRYRVTTPMSLQRTLGFAIVVIAGRTARSHACSENGCLLGSKRLSHVAIYLPTWIMPHAWFFDLMVQWNKPHVSLRSASIAPDNADVFHFAKVGNLEGVRCLIRNQLASPHDLNSSWGIPVLNFAIQGKHLELCRYLLAEGADPRTGNKSSTSALDIAWLSVLGNDVESAAENNEIRQIFSLFSDSDWIEEQEFSTLHMIVFGFNGRSLSEELNTSTSTINLPDSKGRTPLSWAAARGDHLQIQTLLRHGADPNIGCLTGNSPLLRAVRASSSEGIPILLNAGARLDWTSRQKFTALHYASYYKNDGNYLIPLLEHGAFMEARDSYGWTPLACTTEYDNEKSATVLLEYGARVDVQCHDGWTPLLRSINSNSHKVLKLLLDSGADPNIRSYKGETILHFAARRGDHQTLQLLASALTNTLDAEAKSTNGNTAKQLLELRRHQPLGLALAFENLVKKASKPPS